MFESFKSAETLESELRNWLLQYWKCRMQNNYSKAQLEEVVWLYKEKWIIGILEDVANSCKLLSEDILLMGTTYTELALRNKGLKLIMALIKRYRKAADQGDATAQWLLGEYNYKDTGIGTDYASAVKWFRKAAEQNNALAQYRLGVCYAEGKGVARNAIEAYKWYNLASAQGYTDATTERDTLAASMTPEQIAEAQRLSREFQPHKESASGNSN
jgi:hypothetical protein